MTPFDIAMFHTLRCAGLPEKEAAAQQNSPRAVKLPDHLRAAVNGGMMSLKDAESAAKQLQGTKPIR